jgi:predicted small lipoprotein YifL
VTCLASPSFLRIAAVGVLVAALGLGACGRKGPLDPPPGAAALDQPAEGPPAIGPDGQPIPPPPPTGPKKAFFLDFLLD